MSKAEAFVQDDWMRDGVKIAVRLSQSGGQQRERLPSHDQAAQVLGDPETAEGAL